MHRKNFIKSLALLPFTIQAMKLEHLKKITDKFEGSDKLPALFIGHGNPMNALYDNPFTKSLTAVGNDIRAKHTINAILVVSAHWLTKGSFVNVTAKPETIHDFGGFPDELFKIQYPAAGSPEYAKEVATLAPEIKTSDEWGLDHGAWTVLKHLYPKADIPVFQVSIDFYQPMQYHFNLAKEFKSLREKGVLIIGSGNIVHNLRMSMQYFGTDKENFVFDWTKEFDEYVKKKIDERDFQSLIDYEKEGSAAKLSVPTMDHYAPLMYSLAMADKSEEIKYTYEELMSGGISMRCLQIGN